MTMHTRSSHPLFAALVAVVLLPAAGLAAELQAVHVEGATITHRVAQEQGLFAKYGIEIKEEDSGTGAAMIERIAKGEVEIVDGGIDNGIGGAAGGLDIVVVTQSSLAGQALISINRRDFGLTWNQALDAGGVLVGEEVEIVLDVQAVRQKREEKAA